MPIELIQTVIVSTLLPPAAEGKPPRVRSYYLNDLSRDLPGKAAHLAVVVLDQPRIGAQVPVGLEPHEVPIAVGETRVKITHLDRAETPGVQP